MAGADAQRPVEWPHYHEDTAVESRLRALYRPAEPDPAFVTRLEEELMLARPAVVPISGLAWPTTPNGHVGLAPGRLVASPSPGPNLGRRHWALTLFATAALLVVTLGLSFAAFGPGRPRTANLLTLADDATPSAGAVEFLWETRGDPNDPLGNPSHVAVAPDGNIWVADADNNRFQIFAPDGSLREVWGASGSGDGEFDFTTVDWGGHDEAAIAFAPDGAFYVADPGNHRIQKFGPDRGFLTAWGSEGQEPGQFGTPIDLVVDGQGRVYVLDADRVQVFDADGRFLAEWGERGMAPGQLWGPFGIGLDPDGTLLIAEFDNNRVQRFTLEGEFLDGWGEYGWKEGEFVWAMDAAVDNTGRVFVTDYSNGRVQVFDRDGRFLSTWGKPGSDPGEFASALGVAVGEDGIVYVTDAGKRLQAFRVGDLAAAEAATPAATD